MGLVTCPDCGRSVSDVAAACVGCGRPLNPLRSGSDAETSAVVLPRVRFGVSGVHGDRVGRVEVALDGTVTAISLQHERFVVRYRSVDTRENARIVINGMSGELLAIEPASGLERRQLRDALSRFPLAANRPDQRVLGNDVRPSPPGKPAQLRSTSTDTGLEPSWWERVRGRSGETQRPRPEAKGASEANSVIGGIFSLSVFAFLVWQLGWFDVFGIGMPEMRYVGSLPTHLSFDKCGHEGAGVACTMTNHASFEVNIRDGEAVLCGKGGVRLGVGRFPSQNINPGESVRSRIFTSASLDDVSWVQLAWEWDGAGLCTKE